MVAQSEKQPWEMKVEEISFSEIIQSIDGKQIESDIASHPLYTQLKKKVDGSLKRLFGPDAAERIAEKRPDDYLSHSEYSAKSALSKDISARQIQIIRDLNLPLLKHVFRGQYINWHRAVIERALRDGKKVPFEVLVDYPDLQRLAVESFKEYG